MSDKIKILIVDDEANNLVGFKASFRLDYQIFTALSADEATEILNKNPDIEIVISDQKMPGTTGVQFFEKIKEIHPAPVRMILTAFTDIDTVIAAINRGNIFRHISKPWTETDIRSAIEEGHKFFITTSKLQEKSNELQQTYDDLHKFAYSVTHDVRGPIVSIAGAIGIAQASSDFNEVQNILEMMKLAVDRLDNFITHMHIYYSQKQGALTISEVDFKEIEQHFREMYFLPAKLDGINFNTSVNQEGIFRSDKELLRNLLNNLLSNAFKFQRSGEASKFVTLDISVTAGAAVIAIEDNGIGIEEVHHKSIFDMFFRATSENMGSGIGLYNAKDALKKLNGEITVTSTKGEGTTFTITIPGK